MSPNQLKSIIRFVENGEVESAYQTQDYMGKTFLDDCIKYVKLLQEINELRLKENVNLRNPNVYYDKVKFGKRFQNMNVE